MTATWHLAQINVGRLIAPEGDPQVQGFFDALERINALADASPGFVWRLADGEGAGATNIKPPADPQFIVNMSVWTDAEALFEFVYRSAHTPVMAQRRGWFERSATAFQALWWTKPGPFPRSTMALRRCGTLTASGRLHRPSHSSRAFQRPGSSGTLSTCTPTRGAREMRSSS